MTLLQTEPLTIVKMGHPALARLAAPIEDPRDPRWRALVERMEQAMSLAGGVGLAAPQVAVEAQLVMFHVPAGRSEDGADHPLTVLINPTITPLSEQSEEGYEACLSLPGLMGIVPRWTHIHYKGLDLAGHWIEREAQGFHARVVQHECDHLWGRLYPTRMRDLSSLAFRDEVMRQMADKGDSDD